MTKEDWEFAVSTVIGLIALLGIDWKLVAGRVSVSNQKRQIFLLILVAASLVSGSVGWYSIHRIYERMPYAKFQSRHNRQGAMTSYGGIVYGQTRIHVDGDAIISYKDDYKLAAVGLHYFGTTDINDVSDLNKTDLYDITPGDLTLVIVWSSKFLEELNRVHGGTNYASMLVPNKVGMNQFSTIRQAESMGVIIIGLASGPP
jgi:hypothetical protein